MQPTPALLNQLEQVLSPQNNCVGAGSIFGHGLTLLVSTDDASLATQRPQSTFTAAHILPRCPRHLLELSVFPGGTPSPPHPTTHTPAFTLPTPGLCRAMVRNEELQLVTALCWGGCRRLPGGHLACPWPASPRTDCSLCSQQCAKSKYQHGAVADRATPRGWWRQGGGQCLQAGLLQPHASEQAHTVQEKAWEDPSDKQMKVGGNIFCINFTALMVRKCRATAAGGRQ